MHKLCRLFNKFRNSYKEFKIQAIKSIGCFNMVDAIYYIYLYMISVISSDFRHSFNTYELEYSLAIECSDSYVNIERLNILKSIAEHLANGIDNSELLETDDLFRLNYKEIINELHNAAVKTLKILNKSSTMHECNSGVDYLYSIKEQLRLSIISNDIISFAYWYFVLVESAERGCVDSKWWRIYESYNRYQLYKYLLNATSSKCYNDEFFKEVLDGVIDSMKAWTKLKKDCGILK